MIIEQDRSATPLELLFDLCFVVAVAQAADHLHHALVQGQIAQTLDSYASVFFAIWWAWMNFTWFASAYDTDDVPYRLLALLQIGGVLLLLAAGVADGFDRQDFTVVTVGYVLMRVAMVTHWLRVAHDHPAGRGTALRYAGGIAALQLGWIGLLALPLSWRGPGFLLLAAGELAVPSGPSGPASPPPGTLATSPNATACSLSSCSASACWRRPPPCTPRSSPGWSPPISCAHRGVEPECLHDRPPTSRLGIMVKGGRPTRPGGRHTYIAKRAGSARSCA